VGTLRLCTWNVQLGRHLELLLETIASEKDFANLDVLALQEASEHSHEQDAAAIARTLGDRYCHYQVTTQYFRGRPQANALVWDSRRLSNARSAQLGLPFLGDPAGLPKLEGWLLKMLAPQRRGAIVLEASLAGEPRIRVYSVHADVFGFVHRLRQLGAVLADHAGRSEVGMALIAADLNTFGIGSRPSWQALQLAAATAGFKDVTRQVRWTHEVRRLRLRQKLDFVFATDRPALACRAWTLPTRASDHLPLFAELSWP
jgi:endonuclease/exonuclease/phosphatase family metal-dependent hydrolase